MQVNCLPLCTLESLIFQQLMYLHQSLIQRPIPKVGLWNLKYSSYFNSYKSIMTHEMNGVHINNLTFTKEMTDASPPYDPSLVEYAAPTRANAIGITMANKSHLSFGTLKK